MIDAVVGGRLPFDVPCGVHDPVVVLADDVYGEDPTVNKLQSLAAQMLGKEAGLFVPSGTMGNLISIGTRSCHALWSHLPRFMEHALQPLTAGAAKRSFWGMNATSCTTSKAVPASCLALYTTRYPTRRTVPLLSPVSMDHRNMVQCTVSSGKVV